MSVAVILTCYEEGAYIGAALQSVLSQDAAGRISEIVLADDGSGAKTCLALDGLEGSDPRLRLLKGPGGWGAGKLRNRAAASTSAPLIAFLDGDDLWLAGKLSRQLSLLDADPTLDLVYTGYETMSADGTPGETRAVYDLSRHLRPAQRYFLHDPPILPSSILVRRTAFTRVGGFDEVEAVFQDTIFFAALAMHSRMKGLPEALIRKRYRTGSLSAPRPGLMANHAYAAFACAARDPDLAALVPRRLGERAARLGLVAYYADDLQEARRLASLARALQPLNPRGVLLATLLAGGATGRRLLDARLRERGRLHGR